MNGILFNGATYPGIGAFILVVIAYFTALVFIRPEAESLRTPPLTIHENMSEIWGTILIGLLMAFIFLFTSKFTFIETRPEWYNAAALRRSDQPADFLIHIFTYMFVHANWTHLLLNMNALALASIYERRVGTWRYLAVFVTGGFFAAFSIFSFDDDMPLVGASGAIFALGAAYFTDYGPLTQKEWTAAIFASLGLLILTSMGGHSLDNHMIIAHAAHALGLLGGLSLCWVSPRKGEMTNIRNIFAVPPQYPLPAAHSKNDGQSLPLVKPFKKKSEFRTYLGIVSIIFYWALMIPNLALFIPLFHAIGDPNVSPLGSWTILIISVTYPFSVAYSTAAFFSRRKRRFETFFPALHRIAFIVAICTFAYIDSNKHDFTKVDDVIVASEQFRTPHPARLPIITPYSPVSAGPDLNVLFLGNNYIFTAFNRYSHSMPEMVSQIAASDAQNAYHLNIGYYTIANATLATLWDDSKAQEALKSKHWDYVVIQEHSMSPINPGEYQAMNWSMVKWSNAIVAVGAHPVVFGVWARRPGSFWYGENAPSPYFKSFDYSLDQIEEWTSIFAGQIGAPVVPTGSYWAACQYWSGFPELYVSDFSDPAPAGDYLNALLFYRQLTGQNLDNVTFSPASLTAAEAALVRKCASI